MPLNIGITHLELDNKSQRVHGEWRKAMAYEAMGVSHGGAKA